MEIREAIFSRRSIRNFQNKKVSIHLLKQVIDAGRWAPSSCNIQGWHFIIITEQKIKNELVNMGGSANIKKGPIAILVLYDKRSDNFAYYDHVSSGCVAIENMCLYAHSIGLGTCFINHLPTKRSLKKYFKIKYPYEPIGLIVLGFPAISPTVRKRKYTLEQTISFNIFKRDMEIVPHFQLKLYFRTLMRRIYYLLPTLVKKMFNNFIDKKFVKKFED